MSKGLSGIQINVNHSLAAHSHAFQVARDMNLDFLAVQEPYVLKGNPLQANFSCKTFMSGNKRAILYILNNNLHIYFKSKTTYTSTVEIHFDNFILNLTNAYFPPSEEIESILEELKDFEFKNSFNLLVGDFNCQSKNWGYSSDTRRGRIFAEFLAINNLSICNYKSYGPTFISRNVGFPDLTLINSSIKKYVKNWGVLDTISLSDHKYIYMKLELESVQEQSSFYLKTRYGFKKFLFNFRKHFDQLSNDCARIQNTIELNIFFNKFTEIVSMCAFKSFKKKPKRSPGKFHFWTKELSMLRNRVGKLYKKFIRLKKDTNITEEIVRSADLAFKKERACFKRLLLETKRKAWGEYCKKYNEKFGFLFKLTFDKIKPKCEPSIKLENNPNSSITEKMQFMMNHFFPGNPADFNNIYNPITEEVTPLIIKELEIVFKNLKKGKAPGLDQIDFQIWTYIFNFNKEFLLNVFNTCFRFNYFPLSLRNARVFFLLKDGKDPDLCSSYRPVCLLPTIGKILERLFLNRFQCWLRENNIIHHNQYGFCEGKSCEIAINDLINTIELHRTQEHTALISLDIKAAFDNMD
ncbi:unnamed protein product [Larinioides sclopetarius]|uniref:Reverse transcriptase domain-containing protein n=1 Tax=Larinioides sclopetarius TaxID=280406 RepID=A0AAV1ZMG3_9ARAC